ncbi:ParB/RepB/Spo0J family partition protein (plasmid) [Streptomyces sp. NBC_01558]|uniref:ParB/RepB/Spo0J family partition protein n=1 Tax=Streptomyces sp. NBC_01558 TaxID=2975878 RepID=UPI002DDC6439|nr:ParB/RepB/Spo0J family partition protein [Streptomyces sp. NBC_01558]WSD82787.1 ParB/RepB/Spo0J family partition protein [Streptomyces sp. NBC_01558]
MSKADQLGAGRFGGGVRPVSARRQAVAAATGVPTDAVAAPTELSLHRISPNPDNPRSKLGDLTDLAGSLRTHGQKQAITVMNRDAYVRANPEREADLEPDTTHVVVDGSSRLAAAREAGLDTLKVMVSDDQGTTSEELLESALVANIHRQALEELDEARALERLLAIYGSQRALATRLHRSQGWVSQRLALLNLTPELQARIGQEPIDLLRAVGNKPAEQQEAALDELKEERLRKEEGKQARAAKKAEAPAEPKAVTQSPDYAVITDPAPAQPTSKAVGDYAVITDQAVGERTEPTATDDAPPAPPAETVPEPRSDSHPADSGASDTQQRTPPKLPYDDGLFIAMHLIRKMNATEFDKMLDALNDHQRSRTASDSPAGR